MKTQIICALAAILVLASCERQFPTTPGAVSTEFYPVIQTTNAWTFTAAQQRPGATVPFELIYNSYSPIKEINAFQVVNRTVGSTTTRDTTRFFTAPYQAAFSQLKGGDTLLITYTVPTIARPAGTTVAVNLFAEVVTQGGLNKRRAFSTANGFVIPAQ